MRRSSTITTLLENLFVSIAGRNTILDSAHARDAAANNLREIPETAC